MSRELNWLFWWALLVNVGIAVYEVLQQSYALASINGVLVLLLIAKRIKEAR